MAGVFQPGVFQRNVFQLADAQPQPPAINSFGSIEAAMAVHTKPLRRKLPKHVQEHLLKQIRAQARADAQTRLLLERVQLQLVQSPRRAINSSAGLLRRVATTV